MTFIAELVNARAGVSAVGVPRKCRCIRLVKRLGLQTVLVWTIGGFLLFRRLVGAMAIVTSTVTFVMVVVIRSLSNCWWRWVAKGIILVLLWLSERVLRVRCVDTVVDMLVGTGGRGRLVRCVCILLLLPTRCYSFALWAGCWVACWGLGWC